MFTCIPESNRAILLHEVKRSFKEKHLEKGAIGKKNSQTMLEEKGLQWRPCIKGNIFKGYPYAKNGNIKPIMKVKSKGPCRGRNKVDRLLIWLIIINFGEIPPPKPNEKKT